VLHDPVTKKGVAFIGVNNPHISEAEIAEYKVCETLEHAAMDEVFYPDDIERGVTFACHVNDIDKIFEEIPLLGDLELLE
jgi:hypothetical protein